MSVFRVTVAFGPTDGSRWVEVTAMVDTGSTFCKIPKSLARELGLRVLRHQEVVLADERRIEREVVGARLRCEGRETVIPVTIGEDLEATILGATAMELLGFAADPVNETLVPTVLYEFAATA